MTTGFTAEPHYRGALLSEGSSLRNAAESYPKPFVVVVAANDASSLESFACRAAVVVSQKGWAPGGLHAFHHLCRRLPQSNGLIPAQMLLAALI